MIALVLAGTRLNATSDIIFSEAISCMQEQITFLVTWFFYVINALDLMGS